MSQLSYSEQVAMGLIPGAYKMIGYGNRVASGAETNFPVWPNGNFVIPTEGGLEMNIFSSSANDTVGGTGARYVEIHYLNDQYDVDKIAVALNGITPVPIPGKLMGFVQCMHIAAVGSAKAAVGNIYLQSGGITYSEISAGQERCSSSYRMVPAGKQMRIEFAIGSSISGTAAARAEMDLVATQLDTHQYTFPSMLHYPSEAPIWIPQMSIGLQDNNAPAKFSDLPAFKERTVVGVRHSTDKGTTSSVTWIAIVEGSRVNY